MATFGLASENNLKTVHPDLQRVCHAAIRYSDFAVTCGHRDEEAQNKVFSEGLSEKAWPSSLHNKLPALAVDLQPYPAVLSGINIWSEKGRIRFYLLAGVILTVAQIMHVDVRWGGDWNRNNDPYDQKFFDLPHFELLHAREIEEAQRDLHLFLKAQEMKS